MSDYRYNIKNKLTVYEPSDGIGDIHVQQTETPLGSICTINRFIDRDTQRKFAKLFAEASNMAEALKKSQENMMLMYQHLNNNDTIDKEYLQQLMRDTMASVLTAHNKATGEV